ncbi:MAG: DUF502 domain-containing protein [Acidiferrobacterales bacterium]
MRRYLIAGLLVWVPLGVTFVIIKYLVDLLDQTLLLLPLAYRPETLTGFYIPGLGVILTVLVLLVTGMVAANLFGRTLVNIWERLLARIPLVRSIYSGVKQIMATLFSDTSKSFKEVVMVEYPRRGAWTLAFVTGTGWQPAKALVNEDLVNIYVPTTPNPTSGFFLMVPRKDIMALDLTIDEGLKMILSLGLIEPGSDIGQTATTGNGPPD